MNITQRDTSHFKLFLQLSTTLSEEMGRLGLSCYRFVLMARAKTLVVNFDTDIRDQRERERDR